MPINSGSFVSLSIMAYINGRLRYILIEVSSHPIDIVTSVASDAFVPCSDTVIKVL